MKTVISFLVVLALPVGANAQTTSAQPAPTPVATKSSDAEQDRIICRRVEVTGSLVKRGKVCKPASEWARIIDRGNDNARRTVESGMACAGGPLCNGGD